METVLDDRFVVYLRAGRDRPRRPETAERAVKSCSSYKEAREAQRQYRLAGHDCVVRFVGPAGGGD